MKIVVFGLTITSSWGNGHATLWRGLCEALARRRHQVIFFERDAPYYAGARDLYDVPGGRLVLYREWQEIEAQARRDISDADVAMVTSYCPDGIAAGELMHSSGDGLRVFYDLDTPVTLAQLSSGAILPYIGPRGLADFDLVLSYTGGAALTELRDRLGARRVVPLYGHVDGQRYCPVARQEHYRADLSYLGTFSSDRQAAVETLFVNPARRRPELRFLLAGAQYPDDFPWSPNIYFVRHLPPSEHQAFFSSSRLTLNVTRLAMAKMGWCPSGRLFEAAACGTPILTDRWDGLEAFFAPGEEILVAAGERDVHAALDLGDAELTRIGRAARERALAEHTSERRAEELIDAISTTFSERAPRAVAAQVSMEAVQCGA
jgi:spore maturation protein CgeB